MTGPHETATPRSTRRAGHPNGGRVPTLTPEAIVDRALELTEREGPAALTLRRLGQEIGVNATAFYRHFRDKDDLVLACLDRIIEQSFDSVEPRIRDAGWEEVLRAIADESWRSSSNHPAIYSLAFARTTGGPGERRMVELMLKTLGALGLDRAQTVLHYRSFVDAMLGMCGINATITSLEPEVAAKDASAWTRIYAVLPEAEFPAARAHVNELATTTERAIYDSVIDSIIGSIQSSVLAQGGNRGSGTGVGID
jgi:AcrR family transcriptional regulator